MHLLDNLSVRAEMAPSQTPIIDSADEFVDHSKCEEPMKLGTQCTLGTRS